jgi:hypothetical protein
VAAATAHAEGAANRGRDRARWAPASAAQGPGRGR